MRHAEAGMASTDVKRQLTSHGMKQALESAFELKKLFSPQYVIVSPAIRTKMTADQVASVYGWNDNYCVYIDVVYNASQSVLIKLIESLPNEYTDVLLIAHNPGVSNLVGYLTSGFGVGFSPGTFALLDIDTDSWSELSFNSVSVNKAYSPL